MAFLIPRKEVSYSSVKPSPVTQEGRPQILTNPIQATSESNPNVPQDQRKWETFLKRRKLTDNTNAKGSQCGSESIFKNKRARGIVRIVLLASLIILPMSILPIYLALLVFRHKVDGVGDDSSNTHFLVDYSATTLATITSFMSTFSTWVASPAMLLLRYPIASQLYNASKTPKLNSSLPTPYQLNILIALLSAQLGSLWDWLKYKVRRNHRSSGVAPQISTSAAALLLLILLSTAISAGDTWFHLTTKTVSHTQSNVVPTPSHLYGRDITPACENWYSDWYQSSFLTYYPDSELNVSVPCSLTMDDEPHGAYVSLTNASEALATASNSSATNTVVTTILDEEPFVIIADFNPLPDIDFIGTSFAASTKCISIAEDCFESSGAGYFNCSTGNFAGTLSIQGTYSEWQIGYLANTSYTFQDSQYFLSLPILSNYSWILIASVADEEQNDDLPSSTITNGFAFYCNTLIWNVTYSVSNGSYSILTKELSNRPTALSLIGAITSTNLDAEIVTPNTVLEDRFTSIALSNSSLDGIVDEFALEYSALTIGFAAAITMPIINRNESLRTSSLVAQISKAPFFTLLALTAAYVLGGISLAIMALYTSRHTIHKLQGLLSLPGITAAAFEQGSVYRESPVGDMADRYEEIITNGKFTSRISVEQVFEGFWQFGVLDMLSAETEGQRSAQG